MNVFIIGSPLETAEALDARRLNKQIIECTQIEDALSEKSAWSNHPCTLQYWAHRKWLFLYARCLYWYKNKDFKLAKRNSDLCDLIRPPFHTREFFDQMKRRLYTKNPEHYKQWESYGTSEENWYWSPTEYKIIKYVNGKRV